MDHKSMMEITKHDAEFEELLQYCMTSGAIDSSLYTQYDVKRGLRDSNGNGVLTGLTEISDVVGCKIVDGKKQATDGKLYYQGYDVTKLIAGSRYMSYGFEEVTYLLLFGALPTQNQLKSFIGIIHDLSELTGDFIRDVIMKAPSANLMNSMMKSLLNLYSYDENPDDISVPNVLRQSLQLIAKMPMIAAYSYQAYGHFKLDKNMIIRNPRKDFSTAQNILHMLRSDGRFTELEAKVLDVALILHAEHGGGNNSTFTTHVVTSSGTDTYSAIAAGIASLKGPRHGGANLKVQKMMDDIQANVKDWSDENEVRTYLIRILDKEEFDQAGLIYGMGHAVYTDSDPRAVVLKGYAKRLSEEKGLQKEFALYELVEKIAGTVIAEKRKLFKPVCANVDFYSGFVYKMLGIPEELYTPIFAIARIAGWSAHRLEELVNKGKIIRPAYKYVGVHRDYIDMEKRTLQTVLE